MLRFAKVYGDADTVARYLPDNYSVIARFYVRDICACVISGTDSAGWTLDGYVLPRLASGLYFGKEIAHAGDITE